MKFLLLFVILTTTSSCPLDVCLANSYSAGATTFLASSKNLLITCQPTLPLKDLLNANTWVDQMFMELVFHTTITIDLPKSALPCMRKAFNTSSLYMGKPANLLMCNGPYLEGHYNVSKTYIEKAIKDMENRLYN